MATFYSSSTGQREQHHMHSNPSVMSSGSMMYMQYPSSGAYSDILAGINGSQHYSSMLEPGSVASHIINNSYDVGGDARNEMSFIQMAGGSNGGGVDFTHNSVTSNQQMGLQSSINRENTGMQQASISAVNGQGLSLSLGTQIPMSSFQYHPASSDFSMLNSHQSAMVTTSLCRGDDSRNRVVDADASSYALSNIMNTIPSSKYLKVAQRLLDEVVNIQKIAKQKTDKSQSINTSGTTSCKDNDGSSKTDVLPMKIEESSRVLSSSEKQDFQNKLAKLSTMLDEVDKRYKLYHHQMQFVVTSFDAIAGCGAAKPYTSLALQTISRQFRNLRDAINGQIRATRDGLGELDNSSSKGGVITRLRYVDQHLRQQRAIQQMGMYQQHVWRPQRGLPETSVSILRAWLFEHFLHPYPAESEKLMLARQTGLTRGQISNWFINARVRLWKPMIEDIYKEEMGDAELDSNSSENASKDGNVRKSSKKKENLQSSIPAESPKASHISKISNGDTTTDFHNDATASDVYAQRQNLEEYGALHNSSSHDEASARFMTHQVTEIEKYASNGVSLTLGLQHCNGGIPMHNQQGFVTLRGDDVYNAAPALTADIADYDYMSLPDQRHRFGSSHLLHDFVT